MLHLLHKLQRQPLQVRKQFALLFSASVTGIIVIFWIVGVSAGEFAALTATDTETKETGPFKALTEGLSTFWNDTTGALNDVAGAFSSLTKEFPSTTTNPSDETVSE